MMYATVSVGLMETTDPGAARLSTVPLVVQSDLFDLTAGDPFTRPDPAMGYAAVLLSDFVDEPDPRPVSAPPVASA